MAVQYETLSEFKAYTTRISEYIAKNCLSPFPVVSSPLQQSGQLNEFQSFLNNSGVEQLNFYQKTIVDGKVKQGRKNNQPIIVFNDEKSSNLEDLNVLEYIAYKLGGLEPEDGLALGLYGVQNPFNVTIDNYSQAVNEFGFIPYVYIKSTYEYIMLNPDQIPGIVSTGLYGSVEEFISIMTTRGFVFHIDNYNLTDR